MNKHYINRDRFFEMYNNTYHKYLSALVISMQIFLNKNYDEHPTVTFLLVC